MRFSYSAERNENLTKYLSSEKKKPYSYLNKHKLTTSSSRRGKVHKKNVKYFSPKVRKNKGKCTHTHQ